MKRNAIARIMIYAIIILLLSILLLFCLFPTVFNIHQFGYQAGTTEEYANNGGSVFSNEVKHLKIEWAAGDITIQAIPDSNVISFAEYGSDAAKASMVIEHNADTLELRFSKQSVFHFGFTSSASKSLVITVPEEWICESLDIDSASTDAVISNLSINRVDLDSASNDYTFKNCTIGTLDMDGASNTLQISGRLKKLDCDGMSTEITANLENTPNTIKLDGMSSAMDLTLPVDCGFIVTMDGMSSHFTSDFKAEYDGTAYVYADQTCSIDVDGMSCEISIHCPK